MTTSTTDDSTGTTTKVKATTALAALAILILFGVQEAGGIDAIPGPAFTGEALAMVLAALGTWAAGYIVPEGNPSPSAIDALRRRGVLKR